MGIQIELNKGRVPVKVWTRDIEPEAIRQLLKGYDRDEGKTYTYPLEVNVLKGLKNHHF